MRGVRYGDNGYWGWVRGCSDIDAIGRYVNQLISRFVNRSHCMELVTFVDIHSFIIVYIFKDRVCTGGLLVYLAWVRFHQEHR